MSGDNSANELPLFVVKDNSSGNMADVSELINSLEQSDPQPSYSCMTRSSMNAEESLDPSRQFDIKAGSSKSAAVDSEAIAEQMENRDIESHKCEVCNKTFNMERSLNRHNDVHRDSHLQTL